jgi:hypothetical protein
MAQPGNSIALWCVPNTKNSEPSSVELHVNFWHFNHPSGILGIIHRCPGFRPKNMNSEGFVEIGLKIEHPQNFKQIFLSLPFEIEPECILDLGSRFKDIDLATAIFNETLNSNLVANEKYVDLKKGTQFFTRVCWISEKDFSTAPNNIEKNNNRTLIKIESSAINCVAASQEDNLTVYLRFRILLSKKNAEAFIQKINPIDLFFATGYTYTEYIDFRLNRIRNLPEEIRDKIFANPLILSKVNFFVITSVLNNITTGHQSFTKSRILEHELWSNYFDEDISSRRMVTYQWKADNTEDYSAFAKICTHKTGILGYILSLLIIGITVNVLHNWFFS